MSESKTVYRIRGLDQIRQVHVVPPEDKLKNAHLEELVSRPDLRIALRAISRPIVTEFIPCAPIERLSSYWPTFPFYVSPWMHMPIKTIPTALGPHLSDATDLWKIPDLLVILKHYWENIREAEQIDWILPDQRKKNPKTPRRSIDSPSAFALMFNLFERSNKDFESRCFEAIKRSPVAAYIMLHTSCRPDKREELIRAVLPDPKLTFDLCDNPHFREHISEKDLESTFENSPHLLILALYEQLKYNEQAAWEKLMDVAGNNALAAAFAIALDPKNERVAEWNPMVIQSPEAVYWAMRVWLRRNFRASEFPHWLEYQTVIKKDVRWLFHWLRDIDPTEAKEAARWHWPSPWAVEIIADLKLESTFVRSLYESLKDSDDDDPWARALFLWGGDYVKAREAKANETPEDR